MFYNILPQRRRYHLPIFFFSISFLLFILCVYFFAFVRHDNSVDFAAIEVPSTDFPPTTTTTDPVRAAFVILVRNSELDGIAASILQLEERFNWRFNYPYVFLNDDEFTDQFKKQTSALTRAQTHYGKVDVGMWGWPQWVNQTLARENMDQLRKNGVVYGGSESYRHMCRFQSGFFFRHPLLDSYDYYWRVEPSVDFYCDIEYDVFRFMKERKLKYGFTMTFREYMTTIPTLWDTVKKFRSLHQELFTIPQEDTLWKFVTEDNGETYNTCHFWTNFEIASLEIWRSGSYLKFFDYLDRSGGFFYERWGDAPVHSIAATMFLRKSEVHFFNDIGYKHTAYMHCPTDPKIHAKCDCDETENHDLSSSGWSCFPQYLEATK